MLSTVLFYRNCFKNILLHKTRDNEYYFWFKKRNYFFIYKFIFTNDSNIPSMKKNITIIVIATFVILIFTTSSTGFKNYRNFKKIEVGMTESEIFERMGLPAHSVHDNKTGSSIYLYQPPFYYVSDQIKIVVRDDDKRVIKLVEPE